MKIKFLSKIIIFSTIKKCFSSSIQFQGVVLFTRLRIEEVMRLLLVPEGVVQGVM